MNNSIHLKKLYDLKLYVIRVLINATLNDRFQINFSHQFQFQSSLYCALCLCLCVFGWYYCDSKISDWFNVINYVSHSFQIFFHRRRRIVHTSLGFLLSLSISFSLFFSLHTATDWCNDQIIEWNSFVH